MSNEGIYALFRYLFGKESELYTSWKLICHKSFEEFSLFMATFFLECRFRMTYQRLYDDKNVDTSNFMHPRRYKELWYLIDSYNKSDDYTLRAWEVFEDTLNKVLKDTCIPTKGEFKMVVTTDDDKH